MFAEHDRTARARLDAATATSVRATLYGPVIVVVAVAGVCAANANPFPECPRPRNSCRLNHQRQRRTSMLDHSFGFAHSWPCNLHGRRWVLGHTVGKHGSGGRDRKCCHENASWPSHALSSHAARVGAAGQFDAPVVSSKTWLRMQAQAVADTTNATQAPCRLSDALEQRPGRSQGPEGAPPARRLNLSWLHDGGARRALKLSRDRCRPIDRRLTQFAGRAGRPRVRGGAGLPAWPAAARTRWAMAGSTLTRIMHDDHRRVA